MQRFEHRFFAMGGPCRFRIDHADWVSAQAAIEAAEAEVRRLEQKYSRYLEGSLVSQINERAGSNIDTEIDVETAGLLNYADTLYRESEGLFDLTSGILRRAWDFKAGTVPAESQIEELLPLIGWYLVAWDESTIRLPREGMEIDFGGCVKEYASDSATKALADRGIENALVDLGGDMAALGKQADGRAWEIGIRHPRNKSHAIARVALKGGGLASSGDYERCLQIDGKRFGHILNPHSGWPVQGLVAVSVIAEQCLVAGSTATMAMLKPTEEALQWLDELGLPWLGIDADLNCHGTIAGGYTGAKRE
jgi:thiamine biosynthesis lipoprotein